MNLDKIITNFCIILKKYYLSHYCKNVYYSLYYIYVAFLFIRFRYFLQEIQMGETLIARGDFESGVEHLANALVVCGQPARLLQVLQTTLPAQVFAMLILKMQEFGNRSSSETTDTPKIVSSNPIAAHDMTTGLDGSSNGVIIDDLE